MESLGLKQEKESAQEQEPFDVEKGLKRERTILGEFRGKAERIARVLLLVSALSAGAVSAGTAEASHGKGGQTETEFTQSLKEYEETSKEAKQELRNAESMLKDQEKTKSIISIMESMRSLGNTDRASIKIKTPTGAYREAYSTEVTDERKRMARETFLNFVLTNTEKKSVNELTYREIGTMLKEFKMRLSIFADRILGDKNLYTDKEETKSLEYEMDTNDGLRVLDEMMEQFSALSAESIITKEARAEEPGTSMQTEHNLNSPDEQETIESKKNITTSSQWAERYVNNAQAEYELANIKTKEEARQFIITFVDTFIAEFYLPTEGQILKNSAHTIGKRFYTGDDLNNIAEQAAKMKYIIRNLIVRIYHDEADIPSNESEFYHHRLGQITDIRGTMLDQSARRPEISDSDYIKKEIEEMAKKTPKSEKKIKYTEEERYL